MIKTICICRDEKGSFSAHIDKNCEDYTREELQEIHKSWGELVDVFHVDCVHISMLL